MLHAGPLAVVANGDAPRGELVTAAAGPGPGSAGQDAGGLTWDAAVADVRDTLPPDVWRVLSPEFLLAFWALSYQDVFVPAERCACLCPPRGLITHTDAPSVDWLYVKMSSAGQGL